MSEKLSDDTLRLLSELPAREDWQTRDLARELLDLRAEVKALETALQECKEGRAKWTGHAVLAQIAPDCREAEQRARELRAEVERLRRGNHTADCDGEDTDDCACGAKRSSLSAEAERLREALRALEDRVLLTGSLPIPCIICGANGPRFYQSDSHECIERRQKLERAALTEEGSDG